MRNNLLNSCRTDRCATDGEIRAAGAAGRIMSRESSAEDSRDATIDASLGRSGDTTADDIFCEMQAETGEWVQMYRFELEFVEALDAAQNSEPAAN